MEIDDSWHEVLYRKTIRPKGATQLDSDLDLNYKYTGVTRGGYDRNGIPYDEAIEEVKEVLR